MDTNTYVWNEVASMEVLRGCICSCFSCGSVLYVFGGIANYDFLNAAESLNIKAEKWRTLLPIPSAKIDHGAALMGSW